MNCPLLDLPPTPWLSKIRINRLTFWGYGSLQYIQKEYHPSIEDILIKQQFWNLQLNKFTKKPTIAHVNHVNLREVKNQNNEATGNSTMLCCLKNNIWINSTLIKIRIYIDYINYEFCVSNYINFALYLTWKGTFTAIQITLRRTCYRRYEQLR